MLFKRGFALPDLLVALFIIAILAVILFPVFARFQEQSDRAACMANVMKLNLAIRTYTVDHDDMFPFGAVYAGKEVDNWWKRTTDRPAGGYSQYYMWADVLLPYVMTEQTFTCPYRQDDWIGYSWSVALGYTAGNPDWDRTGPMYDGRSVSQVAYPSLTPMISDHRNRNGNPNSIQNCLVFYIVEDNMNEWSGLHDGLMNIGFVDGHAEAYRPEDAWDICLAGERGSLYWYIGRPPDSKCGVNW